MRPSSTRPGPGPQPALQPDGRTLFASLRLRTHSRTPGARAGSAARERLLAFYDRGQTHGAIHEHLDGKSQLFAFRDPSVWFGGPCVIVLLDRAPSSPACLAFLRDALERHDSFFDHDTLLEIPADDPELLRLALDRGFGIDSVILVGSPSVARARLPATPFPAGVTSIPLAPHHIDAVIALHRATFSAHPEHCWFGAFPSHLEGLAASLVADPACQFVLMDSAHGAHGVVLGHVGVSVERDHAFWGTVGGLELMLAPPLRARGVARAIYSLLIDTLIAEGCEVMKGGTSQPSVLHLGRELGRPWYSLNLRRNAHFAPEHFLRFAPPALQRLHGFTR